jgi:hypothetical protein
MVLRHRLEGAKFLFALLVLFNFALVLSVCYI